MHPMVEGGRLGDNLQKSKTDPVGGRPPIPFSLPQDPIGLVSVIARDAIAAMVEQSKGGCQFIALRHVLIFVSIVPLGALVRQAARPYARELTPFTSIKSRFNAFSRVR